MNVFKLLKAITSFTKKIISPGGADLNCNINAESLVVRFSSHQNPFFIEESYCDNPNCKCEAVMLRFEEIIEKHAEFARPIVFNFHLSLTTWKNIKGDKMAEFILKFINEFIEDLSEDMKKRFRMHHDTVRGDAIKKEKNIENFIERVNMKKINDGAMVYYREVFGDEKNYTVDRSKLFYTFNSGWNCYVINDIYCINPRCMCESVVLEFNKLIKNNSEHKLLFAGMLNFEDENFDIQEHPGCEEKQALKLYNKWISNHPQIIDELMDKYDEMREIGQRTLDRQTKGKLISSRLVPYHKSKINRNAPCPCGSGKKYKKCCGI